MHAPLADLYNYLFVEYKYVRSWRQAWQRALFRGAAVIPLGRPARRRLTARWPTPLSSDDSCVLFGTAANDIWPFLDSWEKLEHWFGVRPGASPDTILIGFGSMTRDVRILARDIAIDGLAMRSHLLVAGGAVDAFLTLRTVCARDREGQLGLGTEVWVHTDFDHAGTSLPAVFRAVTCAGLRAMRAELST